MQACHIICKQTLSPSECTRAQTFIVEFCDRFEKLYGRENLVIMHLACHLHECILDYGPVNGFWCFGFERFNGVLGSYPNNNQNVAVTMMKKFEAHLQTSDCDTNAELMPLLSDMSNSNDYITGSLSEGSDTSNSALLKPLREYILLPEYQKYLTHLYKDIYSEEPSTVSALCIRSAKISYKGHILSSTLSRSKSGTCIAAYPSTEPTNNQPHMGIVKFYFKHIVELNSLLNSWP